VQHGFVPGRSCTQLLVTLEIWSYIIDSGATIDVIYLDFRKAVDNVSHQGLIRKLKAYGLTRKLINWISDFFQAGNSEW
jgi:hypothetical protein